MARTFSKEDSNVNLYSVFVNEKNRVGDEFTVSYNNRKHQLKYSLEGESPLTVRFGKYNDDGICENFYYSDINPRPEAVPEYMLTHSGAQVPKKYMDKYQDIPEKMRKIVDGYSDPSIRGRIGIDKAMKNAPYQDKPEVSAPKKRHEIGR